MADTSTVEQRQLLLRLDQTQTRLAEALETLVDLRCRVNELSVELAVDTISPATYRKALLLVMQAKTLKQARNYARVVFDEPTT